MDFWKMTAAVALGTALTGLVTMAGVAAIRAVATAARRTTGAQ